VTDRTLQALVVSCALLYWALRILPAIIWGTGEAHQ